MAVIFSYPIKSTPENDDLILISDGTDNLTKQVRVSTLPGGSAAGVSSFNTLIGAVTITGGTNVTLNPVGNNIEINAAGGGDTYTLQAEAKSNNSVPLKLDAATGSDSTVSLTEGANVTLTRNSATEITIAATGGAAGVSSFTNTNGTYISAGTENSTATGAVTVGTIDLSAVDGTSDTTTRFLSKDNTWDVPSYTAAYSLPLASSSARGGVKIVSSRDVSPLQSPSTTANRDYQVQINTNAGHAEQLFVNVPWTNTTYNAMDASTLGLGKLRYATGSTPAAESQSTTANRTYGITANSSDQLVVNVPWTDTSGISFSGSTANGVATYSNATTANVSANLTFATDTLTVQDNILIKGDGSSDASKLKFNCYNNNHHVEIIGPDHANSPSSYSLTLPNKIASQTAYSSGGRVLESNASGALQWINTPTGGGTTPTNGTWYATLANASGQSYASNNTQAQITITTNNCQWYRVGDMMYYQFYIAGTIKSSGSLTGNLFLCRSASATATNVTTYGLPIDGTYNTVVNDGFCNGSVTITESEAPAQALAWTYPVNGGRVGRDTSYVGYVQLFSLYNSGTTNKVYYPLSNQTWLTNAGEDPANWALGGTINALVEHAS